jgi:hypothetical protein
MNKRATLVAVRDPRAEVVMFTPAMASGLWERNRSNRRFREYHAKRIAALIQGGRWRFNGDTIKIDFEGYMQDGQHRCKAVMMTGTAVQLVIVTGVQRTAFATIDSMRLARSFGDTVTSDGLKYEAQVGTALNLLCRWDRGVLGEPGSTTRVENDEIAEKFAKHPNIAKIVADMQDLRTLVQPPSIGFFYYLLSINHHADIADRMLKTLRDPTVKIDDPFYQLHRSLVAQTSGGKRRDPRKALALMFKAFNAAKRRTPIQSLIWRKDGPRPEPFPKLEL